MTPLLCAEGVFKSWGGRRVLRDATLRAIPGRVQALLGGNGTGKTTLMRIACGCVQPDAGAVRYDDRLHRGARLRTLAARGLFYLPADGLFSDAFTIGAQLEMIRRRFGGGNCRDAAQRMGIADRIDRRRSQLSPGEVRLAECAALFVRRPRCALADEPFRGMGPAETARLVEGFRALAAGGSAVLVSGQDPATLFEVADRVTWCVDGSTRELGSPREAEGDEGYRRVYLEPGGGERRCPP